MPRGLVFRLGEDRAFWTAVRDEGAPFSIRIGRGRESELILPKRLPAEVRETVSRAHARVFRNRKTLRIEDLGSVNFTYANGQIVLAPVELVLPATIRLGEVTLYVNHEPIGAESPDASQTTGTWTLEVTGTRSAFLDTPPQAMAAAWRGVSDRLRWSSIVFEVAECVNAARRAEEVELYLRAILAQQLNVRDIAVLWSVSPSRSQAALEALGVPGDWAAGIQQQLASLRDGNPLVSLELPARTASAWAVRSFDTADPTFTVLVAWPINGRAKIPPEDIGTVLALCLRVVQPTLSALRELESRRASEIQALPHMPSEEMLRICRDRHMWGRSPAFLKALYYAEHAATRYLGMHRPDQRLSSVFVLGETGTGKSALARLIHHLSKHSEERFEELNCAAIPVPLAESELFGYEKGSHDKAFSAKEGLFETANRGTLFLDEIGKTTKEFQSKLLKVLDTGEYRRLGGNQSRQTSCYVILAASEDPEFLIKEGILLEELWYRTGAFTVTLPPLRERGQDLDLLVEMAVEHLGQSHETGQSKRVSPQVLALFRGYHWPGNVRELMQYLDVAHALAPSDAPEIDVAHLPENLLRSLGVRPATETTRPGLDTTKAWDEVISAVEREYLVCLVRECEGNLMEVARRSDKAYQTIHTKLKLFRGWLDEAATPEREAEKNRLRSLADAYWNVIEKGATP